MLRRRNLTSSYLRNRGASRRRMRSPNFQSTKQFLTLLNYVKVLQAKFIFEEKNQFILYSYQNQSLQQIPMLVTVFLQVIKKLFYQTISLLTTFFQVMIKF